jgi:hypothetical protein
MDVCVGSRETQHVLIRVLAAADPATDGWLSCELKIAVGAWSGSFDACLTTWDFPNFRQQLETLYDSLDGTAQFVTLEGQLEMIFTIDNRGHIVANCVAVDRVGDDNRLSFRLEMDQSHLPQIISQLRDIEAAFPHAGPVA